MIHKNREKVHLKLDRSLLFIFEESNMKYLIVLFLSSFLAFSAWAATEYHGNRQSKIYHAPYCRYYDCKNCTAVVQSEEEAQNAGYRRCRRE